ncbi:MAG TPA: hypothetical protein VML95_05520 [Longimicrobiales bacterium]|nr:hypothetical protein [Longimicrobiales bacterium]
MESRESSTPAGTVLVAAMAVAVLAGAPLVYLIWDAVNDLLTGNVADIAVLSTLVAASLFALLLLVLGRSVMRVMGEEHDAPGVTGAGPPPPTSEAP